MLVGCGAAKRTEPCAARDLYVGSLFYYRRRYAERFGTDGWRIVSAKYGLVHPDTVIEPYNLRIEQLSPLEQAAWAENVGDAYVRVAAESGFDTWETELHAGKAYRKPLDEAWRFDYKAPLAHLGMFDQFKWYRDALSAAA